jgi:hypothetical protein
MPIPTCEVTKQPFEAEGSRAPVTLSCEHVFSLRGVQQVRWLQDRHAQHCHACSCRGLARMKPSSDVSLSYLFHWLCSDLLAGFGSQIVARGGGRAACPRCSATIPVGIVDRLPLHKKLCTLVALLTKYRIDPGCLHVRHDKKSLAYHSGSSPVYAGAPGVESAPARLWTPLLTLCSVARVTSPVMHATLPQGTCATPANLRSRCTSK